MNIRKESGFTLIELLAVMVLLAILAVGALPRFIDFSDDANSAVMESALGAVKSASAIAHAGWLASGSSGNTINMDGVDIDMSFGYPTSGSICEAAGLDDFNCRVAGRNTIVSQSGAAGEICFRYRQATGGSREPLFTSTNGVVSNNGNCSSN